MRPNFSDGEFERLASLAAGELAPDEAAAAQRAVDADAAAASQVRELRSIIDAMRRDDGFEPSPEAVRRVGAAIRRLASAAGAVPRSGRWWEGLVEVVARLVHDNRQDPALAGFRGGAEPQSLVFEADGVEIDLQIEPLLLETERRPQALRQVIGQVSTSPSRASADPRVAFARSGTRDVVEEASVDAHGMFSIAVRPGRYDLLAGVSDAVVVVRDVEVP